MSTKRNRYFMHAGAAVLLGLTLAGCVAVNDQEPTAPREITFALWAGVSGAKFGDRIKARQGTRVIQGPVRWKHPITGKKIKIYKRFNKERKGQKVQFFTLNRDKTAMSRVFDRRPGRSDRFFVGDAFFPLGVWRKNETRKYRIREYEKGKSKNYEGVLKIRKISRTFRGKPGSIQYDWILRNSKNQGTVVFHERYDYSPKVGFVRYRNQLK